MHFLQYLYGMFALVIRGARQVGKSTLIQNFCKARKFNLFEINLERNFQLKSLFETFNLNELLDEIEVICEKRGLLNENSVLFLDEIQAVPQAIPVLRYFYEEYPKLKVVAAGSLLEFVFEKNCSMAVRFDLNIPSIQKIKTKIANAVENKQISFNLLSLPLYMIGQMNSQIRRMR